MIFTNDYRMMTQEGHLASNSILAGFEAVCSIDYDRPGTVYSALFQLAIGLERIMKIVFILDHKATNDLECPSDEQLRRLGHSITSLYSAMERIALERSTRARWFAQDTIHGKVLATLSEFARYSRYYNIDRLVGGHQSADPLTRWFAIHMEIAEDALSVKRRQRMMEDARSCCEMFGNLGWEMGPLGQWELSIDVAYRLKVANATRGHCVWKIIEILQPIYVLVEDTVSDIHALEIKRGIADPTVPYMIDFFPFCLTDKQTAIRRKSWTKIFTIAGRV